MLSDEELVERCKRELPGDTRSYEILVSRHMQRVYSIVYRMVNHQQEAEDITQEVFLKVYHHLHTFKQRASFSSWLYQIATNSALDALDKIKRRPTAANSRRNGQTEDQEETASTPNSSSTEDPVAESVISKELKECIYRVLKRLEREQARMLLLRDFNGLAYDEISRMLDVGLSAVKMRIHRARLAFQELFVRVCEGGSQSATTATGTRSNQGRNQVS